MFRIHNPDYLSELIPWQPEPPREREPQRVRFQAGSLRDLREMTKEEWEESKRKALRWQPEGR